MDVQNFSDSAGTWLTQAPPAGYPARPAVPPLDRAVACARREAYRLASGMTSRELRSCVARYRREMGGDPAEGTEEALQLRMIRSLLRRRVLNRDQFAAKVRQAHQR